MVYLPGIPAATDKPAQSQGDIQENFTQLNNQYKKEHVAFDAASSNGQHKFVTLRRSAGVVPAGTNLIIAQALTPSGNPYVQVASPTRLFSIPLTYTTPVVINIPAGSGDRNLIDFAALGFIPQAGTVSCFDVTGGLPTHKDRINFSPFRYDGANIWLPPGTTGQLSSGGTGGTFEKFTSSGTVLQMRTNSVPAGGRDVLVYVTGTAI